MEIAMTTALALDKLDSKDPKIKYGFIKELLNTGANTPELLYEHFDRWTAMLSSENNIFKWTAIDIIGFLSSVDRTGKTDKKIPDLIKFLHGGKLITSNHAIFALGLIAKNKPEYKRKIIQELLSISKDKFETTECKAIAAGKVMETLGLFPEDIQSDNNAIGFIKKATKSRRNATKKKALLLLARIEKLKK